MRVAFLQNIWEDPQGPLLLAEVLERDGHEVRFFLEQRGWFARLAAWRPHVAAASLTTGTHEWHLQAAARVKAELPGPPLTVLGGAHPTFFPEVIEHPAVDVICRGEGERAFPALLQGLTNGGPPTAIPNLWVKRDGQIHRNELGPVIADLDQLPIPQRRMYDDYPFLRAAPYKRVSAHRGCPFNCNYCFNHAYRRLLQGKGPYLRQRSVGHVIAEVRFLLERFGLDIVEFADDAFTVDRAWFLELCREYARRVPRPYWAMIHANHVDEEVADGLKASGCTRAAFSIESANDHIRRDVINKTLTLEQIRRCARLLRDRGVPFQTFNMVGAPGETLENALETVRLNRELRPDFAWCSIVQPYPGTELDRLCREQRLYPGGRTAPELIPSSWFNRSVIEQPDRDRLSNLHKFFSLLVRFPILERPIRRLIELPPNPVFRLIHKLDYGRQIARRNRLRWTHALRKFFLYRRYY